MNGHLLLRYGVHERKGRAVQIKRFVWNFRAIQKVSIQRTADVCHVHANLVGSAGVRKQADERKTVIGAYRFVFGFGACSV